MSTRGTRPRRWIPALALGALLTGAAAGALLGLTRDLPQIRSLETFHPSGITRIWSRDDRLLAELYTEKRDPLPSDAIPEGLKAALIATEDRNFYRHGGLDLKGIVRALVHDIRYRRFAEGASTLTQQLAKTLFLTPRKSLLRKAKEAILAVQLERRYTKDEILTFYLNQIYFGSGAYGVASAAALYFNKPVPDLNLAECALLAALPKAPSRFSPLVNPELAVRRRNIVLAQMLQTGLIDPETYRKAANQPYLSPAHRSGAVQAPYFVDHVREVLEAAIGPDRLYRGGLTVKTTLSLNLQKAAEAACREGLKDLEQRKGHSPSLGAEPQCALVAVEAGSGAIVTMVGGRRHRPGAFNRTVQARRQPGSAFKPLLYAYAIEQDYAQNDLLLDAPVAYQGADPQEEWRPENFSKNYSGAMTLRKALAESRNIPAVRLMEQLGPASVGRFAHRLGVNTPLSTDLSLALGTSVVTLLDLTAAYSVFPGRGVYHEPFAVEEVLDRRGRIVWRPKPAQRVAMSRGGAAIVTDMLQGVIREGSGRKALDLDRPVAGKTGTTSRFRDALFVGFSPGVTAGVWVGRDDFSSLGADETGARAALPIWIRFMRVALEEDVVAYFDLPDNVVRMRIDPVSGQRYAQGTDYGTAALFRKQRAAISTPQLPAADQSQPPN